MHVPLLLRRRRVLSVLQQQLVLLVLALAAGAAAEDEPAMIEITAEQAAQIIAEDGSVIEGAIISEGSSTEVSAAPAAVELTSATFDSMLTNGSTWLVMFYAPWCGHCKRMAPVVETIASDYANAPDPVDWDDGRPRVSLGRVDATKDAALGVRFLIDSFPTIILVEGGLLPSFRYYTGRRAEGEIRDYLEGGYKDEECREWWHPLNPMAPWLSWIFMLHPLRILYATLLPVELMGIATTGLLVVAMLPVYIVLVCGLLIALLETIGAVQRWRRGEVLVSREEMEAMMKARQEKAAAAKEATDTEEEEAAAGEAAAAAPESKKDA
jgi:thiol-disulfide isomerase/thioredoxin